MNGLFQMSLFAISLQDAEEFLGGLIYGLIQKDDLKDIETCLQDATTVEQEINDAIADFMKGDIQSIIQGVELVGKLIQELPTDLQDCQAIQGDLTRIENWASIFSDPSKLVETVTTNLIKNFSKITADITKTSTDIAGAQYYNAGEDIADVMVLTLGAVPEKVEESGLF